MGASIRTLLLTFFYRHFPELRILGLSSRHRPTRLDPVKRGKRSSIWNEQSLEEFLVDSATESDWRRQGESLLRGQAAGSCRGRACCYKRLLKVIDRKCDARIVDAIVKSSRLSKADLRDQMVVAKALASLQQYFDNYAPELSDAVLKVRA